MVRPMCIRPLRKVPAVSTTVLALNCTPICVTAPVTLSFCSSPTLSKRNSLTVSCQIERLGVFSSTLRQAQMNLPRSDCERGLHMAGPFERLSMRNWMEVSSVISPIFPPRASISRTICPFAIPPTAGLQLICPILFMSIVMRQVLAPMRAAA